MEILRRVVFAVLIMAVLVAAAITVTQAWDCNQYVFEVQQNGNVRVRNDSGNAEAAQHADVFINNVNVATFNVPAMPANTGWTNLGNITVPSGNWTWRVEGDQDCSDQGSYSVPPTPTVVDYNPSCADVGLGPQQTKIDPPNAGTYNLGNGYTVTVTRSGDNFSWSATLPIKGVIAKGGPTANIYTYNPPATSDSGLHAPINPNNGQPYGLSHITFCYGYPTPTKTPTPTHTFTATFTPTKTNTPTHTFTPTNTATNTATPTHTFTPSNTPTNTSTPTNTNTPTHTFTPSNTPTNTHTPTHTFTPSNTPTNTATPTNTFTPSNTPTNTATNTPTDTPTNTPTNTPTDTPTNTATNTNTPTQTFTPSTTLTPSNTPTGTLSPTLTPTNTATFTATFTATNTSTPTNTFTPSNTPTNTTTPPVITATDTATFTATFTATPTVFVPVTGFGLSIGDPCTTQPGVALSWSVANANPTDVSFLWWIVGGTASGGPIVVQANGSVDFFTPIDGPLPNTMAIMWVDPLDGTNKTLSADNLGEACGGIVPTNTPTASATPGVLIPVTGIDLPAIFRDSMFLNLGIGIFGFALILLGIGIKMDRDKHAREDEEYEDEE